VVAANVDLSEGSLLRELVGDTGSYTEEEMEDAGSEGSSGLSELWSEVAAEWEGRDRGRPNFTCAATGAGQQQSTQEFFRRGAQLSMGELNMFDTPGKAPMRGALARSLSAAATSSPQQVGTAETLNLAKSAGGGGGKLDVGASDWAEGEAANDVEMEAAAESDGSTTPTPAPALGKLWPPRSYFHSCLPSRPSRSLCPPDP